MPRRADVFKDSGSTFSLLNFSAGEEGSGAARRVARRHLMSPSGKAWAVARVFDTSPSTIAMYFFPTCAHEDEVHEYIHEIIASSAPLTMRLLN